MSKDKGIYEKVAGSGIWYMRYTVNGKIRRERGGTRSTAETLLTKRKAAALTAKLLPELSPQKKVTFSQPLQRLHNCPVSRPRRRLSARRGKWSERLRESQKNPSAQP